MTGFFWNIRGFNKKTKHKVVRSWCREHSFLFGGILETRVVEGKSTQIINSVFPGWSFMNNYDHHRLGRIWIVWSDLVRLTPVFKSSQMITVLVKQHDRDEEYLVTFVYASNCTSERCLLWEDLRNTSNSHTFGNMDWLIMGDFNEIISAEESTNVVVHPTMAHGMQEFRAVFRDCNLSDMGSHGPEFTWCNRREDGLICRKLDRLIVNDSWIQHNPQSYGVFESGGCSDHLRCRFYVDGIMQRPKRPFKFTNVVAKLPEFLPAVENFWRNTPGLFHSTSAMFRFSKKLKQLKPILKHLSRESLSDIEKKVKKNYDNLCQKQTQTMLVPSATTKQEESEAFERWEFSANLEESFLHQKAKLSWLNIGDRSNKIFYRSAKVREMRNGIRELETTSGNIICTKDAIKDEAINYFADFLNFEPENMEPISVDTLRDLLGYQCSMEEQQNLVREVTEDEIREVLFAMPCNKSPGPDGYTVEFFKTAWPIISKDFVVSIQSFFAYGFLPKGVNATILALIPKTTEARRIKDYRPISCCNVVYKVVSKILANRLKRVLPQFIAPNQSAFVQNRLLIENVLLASELVADYHKDSISPRCALKIDISKAFDSVQWEFLLSTLEALNLPRIFLQWIKLCITTASFSVQVNGELAGYFGSKRGLRQGCSLSPYLFVISMNVLSKLLDKAANHREFGFHPRCASLQLTHLCFADDLMVFSDGTMSSIEGILKVFKVFAKFSGLNISMEKSTIYLAGVSQLERLAIMERFTMTFGTLPVRYLGLPLLTKRMTSLDYSVLIDKIRSQISSWTARHLSFAGRLQLLSSVTTSLINFWISAFRLPNGCIDEIERICSAFLWSGPNLNPRKAKISWHDVCKPKEEGGLGLKSIREANEVSILKLVWRILSAKSSLWVKWIHQNLIRDVPFWSIRDPTTTTGSWMWKKILKARAVARDFVKMEVGRGNSISFWQDKWSSLGILWNLTGDRGYIDMGINANATVEQAILMNRRRRHRNETLSSVEVEIAGLRESYDEERSDVVLWCDNSGSFRPYFSTKQTRLQLKGVAQKVPWHKGIWFKHNSPKYAFTTWVAIHNRLPTGDRMCLWSSNISTTCVLCGHPYETRSHLFFDCPFSNVIWKNVAEGILRQQYTSSWSDLIPRLTDQNLQHQQSYIFRYLFQTTIYTLWKERNNRRHGAQSTTTKSLIVIIDKAMRDRFSSIHILGDERFQGGLQFWFASRPSN